MNKILQRMKKLADEQLELDFSAPEPAYSYTWQSKYKMSVDTITNTYDNADEDHEEMSLQDVIDYYDDVEIDGAEVIDTITSDFENCRSVLEDVLADDLGVHCTLSLDVDEDTLTITLKTDEELTSEKLKEFEDWWEGQLSDGWGEGLEQQTIAEANSEKEEYLSDYVDIDAWAESNGIDLDESGIDAYDEYKNEKTVISTEIYVSIKPWPDNFKLTRQN